ncbi:MAG: gephyrin-like molybdotransferase Glp [Terriglobia bacterium]
MLRYLEAREKVIRAIAAQPTRPTTETVSLAASLARVLAEEVAADRDYPPFHRSTRDGFAVRAADIAQVPARLKRLGEIRAGEGYPGTVGPGECVQIMTGAPVPAGADAVVMIEHTELNGEQVVAKRSVAAGANVVPRGSEARQGTRLLAAGTRIGYPEVSLLGQVGKAQVRVYRRPRVAVLSTGDEVVAIDARPGPHQIRNSNSYSMAAQVTLSGGEPLLLGNAPDELPQLERRIRRGLEEDLLVLTGGVSMGKYDLVEAVLRRLGAEFYFDAVAIRPGRPAVFAACRGKFVFGLPGNPVSTMVTFELFVAPAIALLGGALVPRLQFLKARLAAPVKQNTRLTMFLPARLEGESAEVSVRALPWQGSGDVLALTQGNCFLVVPDNVSELPAGSWVDVLPRRG